MAVIRRRSGLSLGSVATTKLLSITSSETLYQIESGNVALEVSNLGSFNVYYGQSNVGVNSGSLLLPAVGWRMWDSVTDDFQLFFRATSGGVTSMISVLEYAGN